MEISLDKVCTLRRWLHRRRLIAELVCVVDFFYKSRPNSFWPNFVLFIAHSVKRRSYLISGLFWWERHCFVIVKDYNHLVIKARFISGDDKEWLQKSLFSRILWHIWLAYVSVDAYKYVHLLMSGLKYLACFEIGWLFF